ncbi:MAG TPA: tetratricopeptide repeat protein [Kofleriaceae bacterium]|nr:tetratricopeptide repeat protein [Kofleriaceae bacterium]
MPVTWENTPMPGSVTAVDGGTEKTPTFEPADFGDLGTEVNDSSDGERTAVSTTTAYDMRAKLTGSARAAAVAKLQELADTAFSRREIGFAVVIGEPGMGKSRMITELVARIRTKHPSAVAVTGVADENAHAYGPVARALTTRFGLVPGEDPAESRDKIQAGVAEIVKAQQVPEVAHLIAHLLRVPFEDSPVVTPLLEAPQRLEARLFMALKRMLSAEADRHPVIVVIENLEMCGQDTINFLHYLANGLHDSRVLLVGTATAQLYERHPAFGDGEIAPTKLELGALSPAEAEDLMRELCKQLDQVPPALLAHARTLGGSPRAIHELVRLLIESDCIVREGPGGLLSRWRVDAAQLAAMTLPTSYDEVVAARMRVMDATERRVLEMAAVVGETSWLDAILALERSNTSLASVAALADGTIDPDGPTLAQIAASGDHSRVSVVAAIGKLIEREWLVEVPQSSIAGERELRIANPVLWSLVYKGIDEPKRRAYHAAVARWLELHPEGRSPAAQEEVARHLALAGEAREAATRYRRSAEAARAQFANETAIRLFDRALACLGSHPGSDLAARLHIWHDLGSVYELIGDFEAALGAFERMLRLSWVAASKTKAAVAFNKMGRVWRRKGDLKLALEYLERGHELFRSANDQRGIAGSLDDIGKSLHMLGRYEEAHAKITEALARRGKSGDKRAIATSLSRLGDVQFDRGQYESALTCHQEALALRKATGDRWGQIVSANNLAALSFEVGDFIEARAGWADALDEAESIGALPLSALILTNLGELSLVEGKQEEARSRLENALEIIEDIEDRGLETEVCRHLALLEKQQGHFAEARELAERALAVAKKAGLREQEAQAFLSLGDVLSASLYDAGEEHNALAPAALAFAKAVEITRSIRNESALGKALLAFGRYKVEVGQISDGKDMIRDAIMLFSKLGLGRPAEQASRLLATLG